MVAVSLVCILLGLLAGGSHATSCGTLTMQTCAITKFMTGACLGDQCECVAGYEPKRTGCRSKLIPTIQITAKGDKTGAYVGGSGEVLEGKDIDLVCSPGEIGDGNYVWMKGPTVLPATNARLTLAAVSLNASGDYRCKIKVAARDYESTVSATVQISVIADNASWTFNRRPVLDGMPARAVTNAKAYLRCVNVPSGLALTFAWYVNGSVIVDSVTQELRVTLDQEAVNYSCQITATAKPNITSPRSSEVKTSTILSDIPGVVINSDELEVLADSNSEIKLGCEATEVQLALPDTIFYSWKKDGILISNVSDEFIKSPAVAADAGRYTCTAKAGNNAVKESSAVTVKFATNVISAVSVAAKTPVPNGYLAIYCRVTTFDLSKVKYSWRKDDNSLGIDEDHILQINGWRPEDNGAYLCEATVGFVTKASAPLRVQSTPIDTLSLPAPTVTPSVTIYGIGSSYTLTCDVVHITPGMTYKWQVSGKILTDQTSNTLQITAPAGTTTYACQITFNGTTSPLSSALTITTKSLLAVTITTADVTYSAIRPLTGASVALTCKETRAPGATSGVVSYIWTRDNVNLTASSGNVYSFTANVSTNGQYACRAVLGGEALTSASLNVNSSDVIETPHIESNPDKYGSGGYNSYSEGGSYALTCVTSSHNSDFTYTWTRNETTLSGVTSRIYQITNAQSGNSGTYTCKAHSGGKASGVSDGVRVIIGAKGKPCLMTDDCDGEMYASACENSRCKCADGYQQKGNTCSGQRALEFSLVFTLIACIITQTFKN